MKKTVKMWCMFSGYLGIALIILAIFNPVSLLFSFLSVDVSYVIGALIVFIVGCIIFRPDKNIDKLSEEPIILESVFGINIKSIEKAGIDWSDIEKASELLEKYKKENNFIFNSGNLFDILVVCYDSDKKDNLVVKVLKNTRKLEFEGKPIIKDYKIKKLDTMDFSNFNTTLINDIGKYHEKNCKLKCVKPIDKYFFSYFPNACLDTQVYRMELINQKGVVA